MLDDGDQLLDDELAGLLVDDGDYVLYNLLDLDDPVDYGLDWYEFLDWAVDHPIMLNDLRYYPINKHNLLLDDGHLHNPLNLHNLLDLHIPCDNLFDNLWNLYDLLDDPRHHDNLLDDFLHLHDFRYFHKLLYYFLDDHLHLFYSFVDQGNLNDLLNDEVDG